MNKEQKQTHPEVGEDATKYGEFVSTYFAWITLPDQKEKIPEEILDKLTNYSFDYSFGANSLNKLNGYERDIQRAETIKQIINGKD